MDNDSRFSILRQEFDPSLLLEVSLNNAIDPVTDKFYCTLLRETLDEDLLKAVEEIRSTKTAIGRLSHVVYLLPWKVQPQQRRDEITARKHGSRAIADEHNQQLRSSLLAFVRSAKVAGEAARDLLKLRFTGWSSLHNATYSFILLLNKSIHSQQRSYKGRIMMFDRGSNLLLSNVRVHPGDETLTFVFISCNSIQSIICHQKDSCSLS